VKSQGGIGLLQGVHVRNTLGGLEVPMSEPVLQLRMRAPFYCGASLVGPVRIAPRR
jgi:hypothetical protein